MSANTPADLTASANTQAVRLILGIESKPHRKPVARAADAGAGVTFLGPDRTALVKEPEDGNGRVILVLADHNAAPSPDAYPALIPELSRAAVLRLIAHGDPPADFYVDVAKAALTGHVAVLVEAQPRFAAAWRELLWGESGIVSDYRAHVPHQAAAEIDAAKEEHRAAVHAVECKLPGAAQRLVTAVERLQNARANRP